MDLNNCTIAIIGLGYVGLPLAIEFGKKRNVIGFDIDHERIRELKMGIDRTKEVEPDDFKHSKGLNFSSCVDDIAQCKVFIITVPTPVDSSNNPDFSPLISASTSVGQVMGKDSVVIYESTVYPGATEEVCVPVLEKTSGYKFNESFFCGYSPERVNPGDKVNTLSSIVKITSGSTKEVALAIDGLYKSIIKAGTFQASSIKVAEAAQVIENTQRDLNIGLINELSLIFHRLGIDTLDVIEAASTKWNFLPFRPGLVGGHCIGVDPYYLVHKAEQVGYNPEVILSGRRVNNNLVMHVAHETIKLMLNKKIDIAASKILILGFSFKENCPDLRNTKVADLYYSLREYNSVVDIYDPWINSNEAKIEYGIDCLSMPPKHNSYSAIVVAVAHKEFLKQGIQGIKLYGTNNCVVFDVKGIFPRDEVDMRL